MSDLFKAFAFDLQRFNVSIAQVGQSGIDDFDIDYEEISGLFVSDVENSSDSSFNGEYVWDDEAKTFIAGLSLAGESGVQLTMIVPLTLSTKLQD